MERADAAFAVATRAMAIAHELIQTAKDVTAENLLLRGERTRFVGGVSAAMVDYRRRPNV